MIELAVSIWQLLHSFDPCADKEDCYLYCFNIELTRASYFFFCLSHFRWPSDQTVQTGAQFLKFPALAGLQCRGPQLTSEAPVKTVLRG